MYTIGKLAELFGLSRSTLLYYERCGLLTPETRTASNYRCYGEAGRQRLESIVRYREAGMPLDEIGKLLEGRAANRRRQVLETQLARLNSEIADLRRQQRATLKLLGSGSLGGSARVVSVEQWVQLLASIGLSQDEMMQWHSEFERRMPEAHQDFLESLDLEPGEIRAIRRRSRK